MTEASAWTIKGFDSELSISESKQITISCMPCFIKAALYSDEIRCGGDRGPSISFCKHEISSKWALIWSANLREVCFFNTGFRCHNPLFFGFPLFSSKLSLLHNLASGARSNWTRQNDLLLSLLCSFLVCICGTVWRKAFPIQKLEWKKGYSAKWRKFSWEKKNCLRVDAADDIFQQRLKSTRALSLDEGKRRLKDAFKM